MSDRFQNDIDSLRRTNDRRHLALGCWTLTAIGLLVLLVFVLGLTYPVVTGGATKDKRIKMLERRMGVVEERLRSLEGRDGE